MVKVLDEDQIRRKKALEEKRAARKRAKAEKEQIAKAAGVENKDQTSDQRKVSSAGKQTVDQNEDKDVPRLDRLPEYAITNIYSMMLASEMGCLAGTCKIFMQHMSVARRTYLLSRCHRQDQSFTGRVKYLDFLSNEMDAEALLEDSLGGGHTGRILPRGKYGKRIHGDFPSYARFIEEIASGISRLSTGSREPILLPRFVQGRFASASPEHTLCRVGGDGKQSGPGGSGVASWGVGRRGQLGHGKRKDERTPRRMVGGLGYGIRIVQVSAGGGLVRVAHSLLLTSTGRVLSFGTGQYGALGHGYSAAKQLPDQLRPKYIEALNSVRCVCVSAGELHSAVVTSDGDLYSWGDGFCGQLGHGDKRPQTTPLQIRKGGIEDEIVTNVSCGSRHTIAVTDDGEVFSWGLGHFGVLGRSFTPFDYDADAAVVAFAGDDHGAIGDAVGQGGPIQAVQPRQEAEEERPDVVSELMAHLDYVTNLTLDDSSDQCIPMKVDSLKGIKIVGSSAGHRHSMFLDDEGALYSCGSGICGCLGHGDVESQMHPMKIMSLVDDGIRIVQMSAGVDMSMAVSSTGNLFAWGKTKGGRIGLNHHLGQVTIPRRVEIANDSGRPMKAADVECGYVHSIVVGLDGTLHICGGVGVDGEEDGESPIYSEGGASEAVETSCTGIPRLVPDFNCWHRQTEPKEEVVKKDNYKKYGKYEVKGRRQMVHGDG